MIEVILILVMVPIAAVTQYMFMTYTRNGYWRELHRMKQRATLGMSSIASAATGLWLFDTDLSPTRLMFWMLLASLVGGEGVQLVVNGTLSRLARRFGHGKDLHHD